MDSSELKFDLCATSFFSSASSLRASWTVLTPCFFISASSMVLTPYLFISASSVVSLRMYNSFHLFNRCAECRNRNTRSRHTRGSVSKYDFVRMSFGFLCGDANICGMEDIARSALNLRNLLVPFLNCLKSIFDIVAAQLVQTEDAQSDIKNGCSNGFLGLRLNLYIRITTREKYLNGVQHF